MAVMQHPYGEDNTEDYADDDASDGIDAYVGTIGPLKRRLSENQSSGSIVVVVTVVIVLVAIVVLGAVLTRRMSRGSLSSVSSSDIEKRRILGSVDNADGDDSSSSNGIEMS